MTARPPQPPGPSHSPQPSRPLRVLLVSHYYPPHVGGIEMVVRQEAVRLAAAGVEVVVLTSGRRSASDVEDGVRVVRVAAWNGAERRAGVPFPVLSPRLLTRALRWARWADVVHVHDCLYLTSWAAGLAAAATRTPLVLHQHVALVQHPSVLVRLVQQAVYAVAGRFLLGRARSVHTLNSAVTEFVIRLGARPERVRHLPNGVDTGLFRPAASEEESRRTRAALGLPGHRPLVLFVGRLVPKKGYDLLLEAADGSFDLVFAGDGDTTGFAGRDDVHHLGSLAPQDLARVYRACDVFALPSTAEGFPLTVQEAMSSGLPVVTTDDPGYAPYRLDGSQAVLVPRRVPELRAALRELVRDRERRADMGSAARRYAETRFAWDAHVAELLEHYRDAQPHRGGR
ncbi:glycosyltransferase family 4 protein [Streptacidiphilus fuscans]|uniref:Glycosyltransferase family 4 protein n=1 Tax=Streptacidiphilus fuscans TaxID=2789292 RepID=A0A931FDL9_9ACTN|nr:glycosyltransferase family 4 protein [Streptacidiphilus fuscans]MBF9068285.1 glycosyltransferase family 4 protein [Streptacidiphilus fuscans]